MIDLEQIIVRPATSSDAQDLAKLIDIAGEGIPHWLWSQNTAENRTPLEIGTERAQRESGGFSYKNARVAENAGRVLGMVLSYPIIEAPDEDIDSLPDPIAPFVELEMKSAGTWYINALAVFPGHRSAGLGSLLMEAVDTAASTSGFSRLSIQVYGQNSGAARLYKRLGFRETARSRVRLHPVQPYYTGDVLLLEKNR